MDDLLSIGLSNAVAAALLALIAIAAGALCRRPALAHGLWLLVLLKLVTPPLVRIPIAWPTNPEPHPLHVATALDEPPSAVLSPAPEQATPISPQEAVAVVVVEEEMPAPVETASASPPVALPDETLWPHVVAIVWLAGSLGWFTLALVRLHRFRRLLRYARPAPAALQERTQRLSRRLGLTRCPQVGLLPGRLAPMLWAVGGSPRLLLAADLPALLSDEQLDTLLVHELAHLRRRDHWVRALEFVVMGLYWWHPIVWYARRELRETEEQCCDAWVVSTLPAAGRTYASALMDTLDFLATAPSAVPPLASGLGHVSDLKRRLTMILRGTTPRALSWPGCLAVVALGAFFLPLLPAQNPPAPSKENADKELSAAQRKAATTQVQEAVITQAQLDADRAKLAVLEVELQQKMAEVADAKARVKGVERLRLQVEKERFKRIPNAYQKQLPGRPGDTVIRKRADDIRPRIRIEIDISEKVDLLELSDRIMRILPPKSRMRGIEFGKNGDYVIVKPVPPGPTGPLPAAAPGTSPEKRLSDLEKKLEKLLQEMQELRKEMKPRPGTKLHSVPDKGGVHLGQTR